MQSKPPKLDVHADKLNTVLKINHNSKTVYILVTYLKYIHDVAYQFIWLLKSIHMTIKVKLSIDIYIWKPNMWTK